MSARSKITEEAQFAKSIVERIMAGDKQAEAEMYQHYRRGLMFLLTQRGVKYGDREDLYDDIFLAAIPKIREGAVAEPERLSGYLKGIAANLAARAWHKQELHNRAVEELKNFPRELPPDQFSKVSSDEIRKIILEVLDEMRVKRDREVLLRHLLYDEDIEVICKDLAIDRVHFRRVMFRAKQRFRKLLLEAEQREGLCISPKEAIE